MTLDAYVRKPGLACLDCTKEQSIVKTMRMYSMIQKVDVY